MKNIPWALAMLCYSISVNAQTSSPDLSNKDSWEVINRSLQAINENGNNGIFLNAVPEDGAMILKNYYFSSGVIEADINGKDAAGQSFVGIAFHVQPDSAYEAVYFRPFNFRSSDTLRRNRSVQYISMPDYPWEKLRETLPGKFEGKVSSVTDPNDWFHVKLVIDEKKIMAYVNNETKPCLEVERLINTTKGRVALWVGNNSSGGFANLKITAQ